MKLIWSEGPFKILWIDSWVQENENPWILGWKIIGKIVFLAWNFLKIAALSVVVNLFEFSQKILYFVVMGYKVKSSWWLSSYPLITRQGMSWKKRSLIICKVSENWRSRAAGHNFLQLSTMNKTFKKSHNFRCLIPDWLLVALHNNITRLRKHIAKNWEICPKNW